MANIAIPCAAVERLIASGQFCQTSPDPLLAATSIHNPNLGFGCAVVETIDPSKCP